MKTSKERSCCAIFVAFSLLLSAQAYPASASYSEGVANFSYSIGNSASLVTGLMSYVIGNYYDAETTGEQSYTIGNYAVSSDNQSYAIGAYAEASGSQSIALGAYSIASENYTVSVGYTKIDEITGETLTSKRSISNVAAKALSSTSSYAATGAQVYNTASSLGSAVSSALYGGDDTSITVSENAKGTVTNTATFSYNTNTYTSVQAVFDEIQSEIASSSSGSSADIDSLGKSVASALGGTYADGAVSATYSVYNQTFTNVSDALSYITNLKVNTDDNIVVTQDEAGNYTISLADDITVSTSEVDGQTGSFSDSVTVGDKVSITADDGVTVNGSADDASVTINGDSITVTNASGSTTITGGDITATGTISAQKIIVADNITIDADGLSINGDSAYFRENSMKVGNMSYNTDGSGRLTGLADGGIYSGSSDAVTGNQLYNTGNTLGTIVASALYGDASYITIEEDGTATSSSSGFTYSGETYTSVQEVFDAIGSDTSTSGSGITTTGTVSASEVDGQTGAFSDSVTVGDKIAITADDGVTVNGSADDASVTIDGDSITVTNTSGSTTITGGDITATGTVSAQKMTLTEGISINDDSAYFRENSMKVGDMSYDTDGSGRLTGLADTGIYSGSTDAVTGNQLWDAYRRMDDLNEKINIVGAHAAALSGLHPVPYNPYEPTTLSASIGAYRDEYSVAVGVFHYVRSNLMFNVGASLCSDGDLMARAGVSIALGKSGKKKPELARDFVGMQQQIIAMQAKLDELEAKNAQLIRIIEQK